jgi:hypothetical protein
MTRRVLFVATILSVCIMGALAAFGSPLYYNTIYGIDSHVGGTSLYTIDPSTGAASLLGTLTDSSGNPIINLMDITFVGTTLYGSALLNPYIGHTWWEFDPTTLVGIPHNPDPPHSHWGAAALATDPSGNVYGAYFDMIYKIDPLTGTSTPIGPYPNYIEAGDFDFGNGEFLGSALFHSSALANIDPMTGSYTVIGDFGDLLKDDIMMGMAYKDGGWYGATSQGQFVSINPVTGAATPISSSSIHWDGLARSPVPESSTLALLGIGILGLISYGRRRRH